jgi:hypothetical protein
MPRSENKRADSRLQIQKNAHAKIKNC